MNDKKEQVKKPTTIKTQKRSKTQVNLLKRNKKRKEKEWKSMKKRSNRNG